MNDFQSLREATWQANRALAATGPVMGTFGNVSVVDREAGVLAIKPSGVPYVRLSPVAMVAVSLETGLAIGSALRPSSDTPTHVEIYRAFACGAVVHTHAEFSTTFAQAQTSIRCMGTTHADYFRGDVPVTRPLTALEVERDYEQHTGLVIVQTFRRLGLSPEDVPAVLVASHGPFTWGADAAAAIEHARALELVARIAWRVQAMRPDAPRPDSFLVDRHFLRKHGAQAYYGQK
jgi:L-ribulose-5-phosphate 4-epimerase